jgi:hypothetical protein
MKIRMHALLTGLLMMVPAVALADVIIGDPTPGCWYLSTDVNSIVGAVLVGVSVGMVVRSRRP